jgi:hypothetical protein
MRYASGGEALEKEPRLAAPFRCSDHASNAKGCLARQTLNAAGRRKQPEPWPVLHGSSKALQIWGRIAL